MARKSIKDLNFYPGNRSEKLRVDLIRLILFSLIIMGVLLAFIIGIGYFGAYQLIDLSAHSTIRKLIGVEVELDPTAKTLFDLFQVLAIPVLLTVGAIFIEQAYKSIETRESKASQQNDYLYKYLNTLKELVLNHEILDSENENKAQRVLNAYTRNIFKNLHGIWVANVVDLLEGNDLRLARKYDGTEPGESSIFLDSKELSQGKDDPARQPVAARTPIVRLTDLVMNAADFSGRKFYFLDFKGTYINHSQWDEAVCQKVSFINVHFIKSSFRDARFSQCDFDNANFYGANLKGALFDNCSVTGAQFQHARLAGAKFIETDLSKAIIDHTTILAHKQATTIYLHRDQSPKKYLVGEDLSETYLAGVSLVNATLTKTNFRKANLSKSDLRKTDLRRTILREAILSGADLRGANLAGADLRHSHLKDVRIDGQTILMPKWITVINILQGIYPENRKNIDLSDSVLRKCYFARKDLSGSNFQGADLFNTNFSESTLIGSDFSTPEYSPTSEPVVITGKSLLRSKTSLYLRRTIPFLWNFILLRHKNFLLAQNNNESRGTSLVLSSFNKADIQNVLFLNAAMQSCDLRSAIAHNADFSKAILTGATFILARLSSAKFVSSKLNDVTLDEADLTNTDFTKAILTNATLTNASLTNATLINADLTNANLTNADLTNADLTNADLTNANLTNANLTNANLTNAKLTKANFTNANFTNANFTNAVYQ